MKFSIEVDDKFSPIAEALIKRLNLFTIPPFYIMVYDYTLVRSLGEERIALVNDVLYKVEI